MAHLYTSDIVIYDVTNTHNEIIVDFVGNNSVNCKCGSTTLVFNDPDIQKSARETLLRWMDQGVQLDLYKMNLVTYEFRVMEDPA